MAVMGWTVRGGSRQDGRRATWGRGEARDGDRGLGGQPEWAIHGKLHMDNAVAVAVGRMVMLAGGFTLRTAA
jgi:hypothetical protein